MCIVPHRALLPALCVALCGCCALGGRVTQSTRCRGAPPPTPPDAVIMAGADGIEQCLKLLKLTPVADLEKNVFFLSNFVDADDLMARVDLPLGVATDSKVDKPFLTCDYNRDEDSFRCVAWRVVPRAGSAALRGLGQTRGLRAVRASCAAQHVRVADVCVPREPDCAFPSRVTCVAGHHTRTSTSRR